MSIGPSIACPSVLGAGGGPAARSPKRRAFDSSPPYQWTVACPSGATPVEPGPIVRRRGASRSATGSPRRPSSLASVGDLRVRRDVVGRARPRRRSHDCRSALTGATKVESGRPEAAAAAPGGPVRRPAARRGRSSTGRRWRRRSGPRTRRSRGRRAMADAATRRAAAKIARREQAPASAVPARARNRGDRWSGRPARAGRDGRASDAVP